MTVPPRRSVLQIMGAAAAGGASIASKAHSSGATRRRVATVGNALRGARPRGGAPQAPATRSPTRIETAVKNWIGCTWPSFAHQGAGARGWGEGPRSPLRRSAATRRSGEAGRIITDHPTRRRAQRSAPPRLDVQKFASLRYYPDSPRGGTREGCAETIRSGENAEISTEEHPLCISSLLLGKQRPPVPPAGGRPVFARREGPRSAPSGSPARPAPLPIPARSRRRGPTGPSSPAGAINPKGSAMAISTSPRASGSYCSASAT